MTGCLADLSSILVMVVFVFQLCAAGHYTHYFRCSECGLLLLLVPYLLAGMNRSKNLSACTFMSAFLKGMTAA